MSGSNKDLVFLSNEKTLFRVFEMHYWKIYEIHKQSRNCIGKEARKASWIPLSWSKTNVPRKIFWAIFHLEEKESEETEENFGIQGIKVKVY
jgi:hypothetical protein